MSGAWLEVDPQGGDPEACRSCAAQLRALAEPVDALGARLRRAGDVPTDVFGGRAGAAFRRRLRGPAGGAERAATRALDLARGLDRLAGDLDRARSLLTTARNLADHRFTVRDGAVREPEPGPDPTVRLTWLTLQRLVGEARAVERAAQEEWTATLSSDAWDLDGRSGGRGPSAPTGGTAPPVPPEDARGAGAPALAGVGAVVGAGAWSGAAVGAGTAIGPVDSAVSPGQGVRAGDDVRPAGAQPGASGASGLVAGWWSGPPLPAGLTADWVGAAPEQPALLEPVLQPVSEPVQVEVCGGER